MLGLGLGYRQEENDAFGLPEKRLRDLRAEARRRHAAARGRGRDRRGARLPAARPVARAAPDPGAAAADLARGEQRQGRPARGAAGRRLAAQPAHEALRARAPDGPLPRRARALRPARPRARSRSSRSSSSATTTSPRCARSGRSSRTSTRPTCSGARARCCRRATPCGRTSSSSRAAAASSWAGPRAARASCASTSSGSASTTFLFRFQWPGMPQELVLGSMRRAAADVFPLLCGRLDAGGLRDLAPGRALAAGLGPGRDARDRRSARARCCAGGAARASPPRRRS